MTIRTVLVLVLSIVCGVSASFGANYLMRNRAPEFAPPKTTMIIVAAIDVPRGVPLAPALFRKQEWPEGLVPTGALLDETEVEGRATLTPLAAGEPILSSKIGDSGFGAAALVRPGMRAYTIATPTSSSGVAGFLQPENRVDVLLTVQKGASEAVVTGGTWTLLQNVEILAADQRLDQNDPRDGAGLRSVTLMVTPDMAAKLTLAQSMGVLNLTLRNDADNAIAETHPITMRGLLFLQEAVAPVEEVAEEPTDAVVPEPSQLATTAGQSMPWEILTLRGNSSAVVRVLGATKTRIME